MTIFNEHLEHEIGQRLMESDVASAQPIELRANDGQLTLRGAVSSFREKLAVHELVKSSPGVKSVNNLLVVRPQGPRSDPELILEIHGRWAATPPLVTACLHADTRSGRVWLTGYVSEETQRQLAADVALAAAGVREVENLSLVNPDRVMANQEHSRAIDAAIHRIIGMEREQLIVSIVDENAQLTGVVNRPWKKEMAETTVRKFQILTVANDIMVR